MNETAKVPKLLKGDTGAWNEFYQSYAPLIRRILSWPKWRFSREEQEDMAQEIFIQIIRAVKSFKGESKISTFVARITQNCCVTGIRKKFAHKRGDGQMSASIDELENILPDPDSTVLNRLIAGERSAFLSDCMKRLEPECRKLILLRYAQEQSYQNLSDYFREPIGTLSSRLKRCLLRLKELYEAVEMEQ